MELKDILIVSDLDGTLIGANAKIPQRNLDALERFKKNGGNFAIATGRSVVSGALYYDSLAPNAPSVLLNGSVIYDFQTKTCIREIGLPKQAIDYLNIIAERFPKVGFEIFANDRVFCGRNNSYITAHIEREQFYCPACHPEEISQTWCKILFAADPEIIDKAQQFTREFVHPGVVFVKSADFYMEMLPEHADKGTGIEKLSEITGIAIQNIYAIGDYYNDEQMLKTAGKAVVPSNAPDDIKALADLVVCSCEEGAVADLIEYIEKQV